MTFQTHVNTYPAPGVVGQRASQNPISTVVAGPGGLVAGTAGVNVGKFAWNTYASAGGPGAANNSTPTPLVPDGFISNEQQALITTWLGESGLAVPAGYPVTEMQRGDFWARNPYADAAIGQKVYANLFSGDILGAATGQFLTNEVGSNAVIASATIAKDSYELNIITLTSGVIQIGDEVFFPTSPAGAPQGHTYIESFNSFNGTSGTVELTQAPTATFTTKAFTTLAPVGTGGGTINASANNGDTVLTVNSVTHGQVVAGQRIKGTSIPTDAYVASLGTYNGTSGTVNLSAATTGTISSAAVLLSAFIETPWSVLAPGNVGDLVKIGIKN
jgi:hypothetical protein